MAWQIHTARAVWSALGLVGLLAAACRRSEEKETGEVDPKRLDSFLRLLDWSKDGKIDSTELSPTQLAHLVDGKKGGKVETAISLETMTRAIRQHQGEDPQRIARFFAEALRDEAVKDRLALSGETAASMVRGLGLTVNECQLDPIDFQDRALSFLQGRPWRPLFKSRQPRAGEVTDPYTQSNYRKVPVRHVQMDLTFDFDAGQIRGRATYTIERQGEDRLVLDTGRIKVHRTTAHVLVNRESGNDSETREVPVLHRFGDERNYLGRPLLIQLPPNTVKVTVDYETDAEKPGDGLQWLSKEQTGSGRKPFFYTQGQYFYNRGWVPLQDVFSQKVTAEMTIRVKSALGLRVLASNTRPHGGKPQVPRREGGYDVWNYGVEQPVAPYLLAIGIGELEARRLSDRSILYAEPHLIKKAAADYAIYGRFVAKAEEIFGPLPFPVIDTLLLPASFPYGGMENVGLNMNNGCIITGDRSLMGVALHELMHSWFGNFVTNTRLEDFWLNEGFTRYAERTVYEALFGERDLAVEVTAGRGNLEDELRAPGNSHNTCLATKVSQENPQDAVTGVPYEKGYLFLKWLEGKLGREAFLDFIRDYLHQNRFGSLTTEDFVDRLSGRFNLQKAGVGRAALDEWLYAPGLPADAPSFEAPILKEIETVADNWRNGILSDLGRAGVETWSSDLWVIFLRGLQKAARLSDEALETLRVKYRLDENQNPEIRSAWYVLVAKNRYRLVDEQGRQLSYPGLERFLDGSIGRGRYIKPVYVALKEARLGDYAKDLYERAKPRLHVLARKGIEKALGISGK